MLTTLMMSTTLQTQAAVGDAVRRALPGIIIKTKTHLKSSLDKVRGFDKSIIIDRLLSSIGKLGVQLLDIKDCMLHGDGCSPTKRAAFYATAITLSYIFADGVAFDSRRGSNHNDSVCAVYDRKSS